jgi:hypothetical protein
MARLTCTQSRADSNSGLSAAVDRTNGNHVRHATAGGPDAELLPGKRKTAAGVEPY